MLEWRQIHYGAPISADDTKTYMVLRQSEQSPADDPCYSGAKLAHWWTDVAPGTTPEGGEWIGPGLDTSSLGKPDRWLWDIDNDRPWTLEDDLPSAHGDRRGDAPESQLDRVERLLLEVLHRLGAESPVVRVLPLKSVSVKDGAGVKSVLKRVASKRQKAPANPKVSGG